MRSYEALTAAFFGVFVAAALVASIERRRRINALALGTTGLGITLLLPSLDGLPGGTVARDFVPAFLLLLGYWQTGQFMVGPDPKVQEVLRRFERRWFPWALRVRHHATTRPGLTAVLEGAYLACYPVVPVAVATLHLAGSGEAVAGFWAVVLPATFGTHALTPLFPSAPPWMVEARSKPRRRSSRVESVNGWVTEHASIGANSFPSGHVACSTAICFVLLEAVPTVGLLFLSMAAGIAFSSVVLRYHYGLDVVLGIAVAGVSFLLLG